MLGLTAWHDGGGRRLPSRLGSRVAAGERRDEPVALARSSVGMTVASLRDPPHGEVPEPHDEPVTIVALFLDGCATGATPT
jgi:hypothetical protein